MDLALCKALLSILMIHFMKDHFILTHLNKCHQQLKFCESYLIILISVVIEINGGSQQIQRFVSGICLYAVFLQLQAPTI